MDKRFLHIPLAVGCDAMFPLFRAGGNKFQGKPREKQLFFCGINLVPARFKDGGSFWASRRSAGKIMKHLIFSRKTYFSPCSEKQPHGRCSLFKALKGGRGQGTTSTQNLRCTLQQKECCICCCCCCTFWPWERCVQRRWKSCNSSPGQGCQHKRLGKFKHGTWNALASFLLLFEAC